MKDIRLNLANREFPNTKDVCCECNLMIKECNGISLLVL
jgi:hypothetical protein